MKLEVLRNTAVNVRNLVSCDMQTIKRFQDSNNDLQAYEQSFRFLDVQAHKLRYIIYSSRTIDDKIQKQFNEGGHADIIALLPEASKLFDKLTKMLTEVIGKVQKARVEYEDELYGEVTTPRGAQSSMQLMERIQVQHMLL
eukprot:542728-Rhodomonas_salina.1